MIMIQPKTACYTKSVKPALMAGHTTILFLISLLMFSEKFTDADQASSFVNKWIRWESVGMGQAALRTSGSSR